MGPRAPSSQRLEPLHYVDAGVLTIAYYEAGPADGPAVMLLHGFPYDIHSYVDVAPMLAAQGCRVIVPYLRGYGPTRFLSGQTPRSGQQAALGRDLADFIDALGLERAVVAGYDWGGRAACIVAALWPERAAGLVTMGGYNVQNIAVSGNPASPAAEYRYWYQWYFHTERGRAGLTANRRPFCRLLWDFGRRTIALTKILGIPPEISLFEPLCYRFATERHFCLRRNVMPILAAASSCIEGLTCE